MRDNTMYAVLQNRDQRCIYVQCKKVSLSYFNFNDDYKSLYIDGICYREKSILLTSVLASLPTKMEQDHPDIVMVGKKFNEEQRAYLKL